MLRALEIVSLRLGDADGTTYEGYRVNHGVLETLPAGSALDSATGVFSWQLGPGFAGVFDLLFIKRGVSSAERVPVRVVALPSGGLADTHLVASAQEIAAGQDQPITLSGWAATGDAMRIRRVDVYAYPMDGSGPVFIGEAVPVRETTDEANGAPFTRSEYSLAIAGLTRGTYDFLVIGRSSVAPALDASVWVRSVQVR